MDPTDMQTPEKVSSDYEYIYPIGYSNLSRCGYCETCGKAYAYHALAGSVSSAFYQTLLDRCWRRSGTLLYRPDQKRSCCPHYTTRLDSREFKPSRDQRQTINRFNKFVIGQTYAKEAARLHPKTKEQAKKRDNEFDLAERIHEAEHVHLKTPPEPAHKLEVTLEEDSFTEEKYRIWENYQHVVHGDALEDISRSSFKRFLCSSPLRRETMISADGRKLRLGSYHQCYRLDGKLVAIGVIDLLPHCVSSVYFLYDESIHKYSPGKLSALREITLAMEEGYRWWYPGFYIHSCPKMRYKLDYRPQDVLDPESLQWDPLDQEVLSLLDKKPFVSLSLERKAAAVGPVASPNLDNQQMDDEQASINGESEDEGEDSGRMWLFESGMPGISSLDEIATVDLDHIPLKGSHARIFTTSRLVGWEESRIDEWPGVKASVAQLIAVIGPDLMDSICLDLTRQGRS